MLGRSTFTQEELAEATKEVEQQLGTYRALVAQLPKKAAADQAAFDAHLFNNLTMMLDRRFVHRVRSVSGKDTNPLTEVELICESLLDHDGVFTTNKVIKYQAAASVVHLVDGDRIALTPEQFEALAEAFLAEIDARCVSV